MTKSIGDTIVKICYDHYNQGLDHAIETIVTISKYRKIDDQPLLSFICSEIAKLRKTGEEEESFN